VADALSAKLSGLELREYLAVQIHALRSLLVQRESRVHWTAEYIYSVEATQDLDRVGVRVSSMLEALASCDSYFCTDNAPDCKVRSY
jgi:hypothetical protein